MFLPLELNCKLHRLYKCKDEIKLKLGNEINSSIDALLDLIYKDFPHTDPANELHQYKSKEAAKQELNNDMTKTINGLFELILDQVLAKNCDNFELSSNSHILQQPQIASKTIDTSTFTEESVKDGETDNLIPESVANDSEILSASSSSPTSPKLETTNNSKNDDVSNDQNACASNLQNIQVSHDVVLDDEDEEMHSYSGQVDFYSDQSEYEKDLERIGLMFRQMDSPVLESKNSDDENVDISDEENIHSNEENENNLDFNSDEPEFSQITKRKNCDDHSRAIDEPEKRMASSSCIESRNMNSIVPTELPIQLSENEITTEATQQIHNSLDDPIDQVQGSLNVHQTDQYLKYINPPESSDHRHSFEALRHILANSFDCKFENCKAKLSTLDELKDHIEREHDSVPEFNRCPDEGCRKSFKAKSKLITHIAANHSLTKMWQCSKCDHRNESISAFVGHRQLCLQKGEFACEKCHKKYKYGLEAMNHYDRQHR